MTSHPSEHLRLQDQIPIWLRICLAVTGGIAIVVTPIGFGSLLFQPTASAAAAWAFSALTGAMGSALLYAAVCLPDAQLDFSGKTLVLTERGGFRTKTTVLSPDDVSTTEVARIDQDECPTTFSVKIHLRNGRTINSAPFTHPDEAEALLERWRAALRRG